MITAGGARRGGARRVAERADGGPPVRPPRAGHVQGSVLRRARRTAWWAVVAVCLLYGGFAVTPGLLQAAALLGLGEVAGPRGAPVAFAAHATAGGIALVTGVLQLDAGTFTRGRRPHRTVGRVYAVAAWCASLAGLWSALAFDVAVAARVAFAAAAALWFAYPVAIVLAWAVNLGIAEAWIRHTRR